MKVAAAGSDEPREVERVSIGVLVFERLPSGVSWPSTAPEPAAVIIMVADHGENIGRTSRWHRRITKPAIPAVHSREE